MKYLAKKKCDKEKTKTKKKKDLEKMGQKNVSPRRETNPGPSCTQVGYIRFIIPHPITGLFRSINYTKSEGNASNRDTARLVASNVVRASKISNVESFLCDDKERK